MNGFRVRHALPRFAFAVGTVAIMAGVAGCGASSAPNDTTPEATETSIATPLTPRDSAITDAESCEAFADVLTILYNATVGLQSGRMTQQEYDGWLRLATRVLDRVPIRGDGAVSAAIATLQEAAPPLPPGGRGAGNIGTAEWYSAAPLGDACTAAGSPTATEAFTGG